MQQDQLRWGRVRQPVLRKRLQRGETTTGREVQMQVSLVLHRAMSELHCGRVDHCLQVKSNRMEMLGEGKGGILYFSRVSMDRNERDK